MNEPSSRLDQQPDEVWLLIGRICDGEATPKEIASVERRLQASMEARELFVAYLNVHAELQWRQRGSATVAQGDLVKEGNVAQATSGAGKSRSAVLGFLTTTAQLSASWLSSPKVLALTVVGCLCTYFLGLMISIGISRAFLSDHQAQERGESPAVAPVRIVAATRVRWRDGTPAADRREMLPAGKSHLDEGVVELEFDGGARVRIEGPAEFAPLSGRRMTLNQGRLVAYVPKQAHGFTVETPAAEVIDLGTEFGIEVDGQAGTSVHVLRGRVEVKTAVKPVGQQAEGKTRLSAGQAVRISAKDPTTAAIPFDESRFTSTRSVISSNDAVAVESVSPFPANQSIWLGNLFDDFRFTGVSLAAAIKSDDFRAKAEASSLGVDRVLYAGGPVQEIAPGVSFDATNLGWENIHYGNVTNDAWHSGPDFIDENGPRGGIRTQGSPLGYNEPRIEEGIGEHANALITFDLDAIRDAGELTGRTLEFRCDRAGINDACIGNPKGQPASVHMVAIVSGAEDIQQVLVDGRAAKIAERIGIWQVTQPIGEPLRADGRFVEFRVSLPKDAKWLTLLTASAGDGYQGDHAVWSGARLEVPR